MSNTPKAAKAEPRDMCFVAVKSAERVNFTSLNELNCCMVAKKPIE